MVGFIDPRGNAEALQPEKNVIAPVLKVEFTVLTQSSEEVKQEVQHDVLLLYLQADRCLQ